MITGGRWMDDRLRQPDALLVALRQVADQALADVGESAVLLGRGHRAGAQLAGDAVQPGAIRQVFVDGELRIHRRLLGQVAEVLLGRLRRLAQVDAGDRDEARAGREAAGEHLHRGGLAGAVGAEQAEDLALLQGEVEAGDGHGRAVAA
jgi:hypothetical protein